MEVKEGGRFCKSCEKMVVNFETMSDEAILGYFEELSSKKSVCGRFNKRQLIKLNQQIDPPGNITFLRPIFLGGALAFSTLSSAQKSESWKDKTTVENEGVYAHEELTYHKDADQWRVVRELESGPSSYNQIKGRVFFGSNREALIHASISVEHAHVQVNANLDGMFILELSESNIPEAGKLLISYAGFKSVRIPLDLILNAEIEVILEENNESTIGIVSYDVRSHAPAHKVISTHDPDHRLIGNTCNGQWDIQNELEPIPPYRYRIEGWVLDTDGVPLIGASLEINNTELGESADVDGYFSIDLTEK